MVATKRSLESTKIRWRPEHSTEKRYNKWENLVGLKEHLIVVHAHDLGLDRINVTCFTEKDLTMSKRVFEMEIPIYLEEMKDYEQKREEATTHSSLPG